MIQLPVCRLGITERRGEVEHGLSPEALRQTFEALDANGDGCLTAEELQVPSLSCAACNHSGRREPDSRSLNSIIDNRGAVLQQKSRTWQLGATQASRDLPRVSAEDGMAKASLGELLSKVDLDAIIEGNFFCSDFHLGTFSH